MAAELARTLRRVIDVDEDILFSHIPSARKLHDERDLRLNGMCGLGRTDQFLAALAQKYAAPP